jgi:hypothetical protein
MQDGELWRRSPRRKVIWKDDELRRILGDFHIDLGHYGRYTTARAVKERYEVARDLWEDALTMLDGSWKRGRRIRLLKWPNTSFGNMENQ